MNCNLRRFLSPLAMAVIAMPMLAQDSTGTMLGTVLDRDSRRPIADAAIEITSNVLIQRRTIRSDSNGQFRFPLLPPGEYSVRAVKDGYVMARQTVFINLGGSVRFEMAMRSVSVAEETVEIVGTAETQDKTDVKTQATYSADKLDLLPRSNKDLWNAAILSPGVVRGVGDRIQMRGAQTFDTKVTLQGAELNDNVFGTNLNTRAFYVDDSIAEVQIITSPINARYGNFTGGIINAITKSGSNDFQGSIRVANITRSSWRSLPPLGPFRPSESEASNLRVRGTDTLNKNWTVWLGGPIIKDRLWFTLSTKLDPVNATIARVNTDLGNEYATYFPNDFPELANVPFYAGSDFGMPFVYQEANQFYEGKLTLSVWDGHTLEISGNTNVTEQNPRYDYNSSYMFATRTATVQTNEASYFGISYLGLFPNNITVESRFGQKKSTLTSGGGLTGPDGRLLDRVGSVSSRGYAWQVGNGQFNMADGGDSRDIQTFFTNVTWYSPATSLGTHVLEGGFEWSKRNRTAGNDQSPTSRFFRTAGSYLDENGDMRFVMTARVRPSGALDSIPVSFYQHWVTNTDPAENNIYSLYLNDTWAINDNWQVMLGLRYDQTNVADNFGEPTIESSEISPRFQVTWDPFGNQRWLLKGSWAKYVGTLPDGFTNMFSMSGNPMNEIFHPKYNNARATWADVINLDNYDLTPAGLYSFSNPTANRFAQPDMVAPSVNETSLEVRYNSQNGSWIRAAYVNRTWANLFDRVSKMGDIVYAPSPSFPDLQLPVLAERWQNVGNVERTYKSFELEFSNQFTRTLSLGGNIVYSVLRGNSDAEGSNPPIAATAVNWMVDVHEKYGRNASYYAPEGYLASDRPYTVSTWLTYSVRDKSGLSLGTTLLFNYNAATPTSTNRTVRFEGVDLAGELNLPITGPFGSTYTRWFSPRGYYRTNDTYSFDLQVNLEIPLYRKVRLFTEATVSGLFNQWMQTGFDKSNDTGQDFYTDDPRVGGLLPSSLSPRVAPDGRVNYWNWGTYGSGNMSGQRNLVLSAGLRW